MSWNNIIPWWCLLMASPIRQLEEGEITGEVFLSKLEELKVPPVVLENWTEKLLKEGRLSGIDAPAVPVRH